MALLIGLLLYFSAVPLVSFSDSKTETIPGGAMVVLSYQVRWPLISVILPASIGFFLLLIPPKKKLPPKIRPET